MDGLLLVDKPSTWTSHDVVAKVRGHFRLKKVGHGGTLDPMATGLLVLLVGRATKLSNRVMSSDKTYEGTIRLGISTDSQDADGDVIAEKDPSDVTIEAAQKAMSAFVGDLMQTPPMHSAIKKDGVPLYKLAHKGKTVEREPRLIHVYEFALLKDHLPNLDFRLRCTKGTYVRTIASDLGDALGCGAHLSALRRTTSGALHIDEALPLSEILTLTPQELEGQLIPPHGTAVENVLPS